MNRNCYRIIFNRKRGMLMVVAATTASMMATPASNAQIVADPTAPAGQQAGVINTANGLPQVNIQTPSAAGVSRNTYSQFDVLQQGAILNNSRTDAQTQLGGWIQGNPNLANGGARIILNEVNSADPSRLNGYLEVAGGRAQVVIANPSGISCDGCGFINASRATLTTGVPIVTGGSLEGYRVRRGAISIRGAGLDARDADYTDIIARATQVNAGIWGKELKVTTGANRIDALNTQASRIETDTAAPTVGIDVAQLGGMYANKIVLIGTGAGVGVRNAGEIGAAAGDVIVRADGMLANSGRILASADADLDVATTIDNTKGQIEAGGLLSLAANRIVNADTGADIEAGKHRGEADAMIAGLHGKRITIAANSIDNTHGSVIANEDIVIAASDRIDNGGGKISAGGLLDIADRAEGGTLHIGNAGGTLIAGSRLSIDSAGLGGDGSILSDADLSLRLADDFVNTGNVHANGKLTLETDHALLNEGRMQAGDTFDIDAAAIDNLGDGSIIATSLNLKAKDVLNNRGLIDAGHTFLDAGVIHNRSGGRIYGDHIAIDAANLINAAELGDGSDGNDISDATAPVIAARARLDIAAQTIENREHATLFSAGDMAIGGNLDADRHASGSADKLANASATIEATGQLDLSAAQIDNTNAHFSTELVETARRQMTEYQLAGSPDRYRPDQISIRPYEADYLVTPSGHGFKFHRYDYTRVVQDTQIRQSEPAKIISGGAMRITADALTNDKSMVMAGAALSGNIGKLVNTEAAGQRIITDSGNVTYFYDIEKRGRDKQGVAVTAYNPAAFVQSTRLAPAVYSQYAKGEAGGMRIDTRDTARMDRPIVLPDNSLFKIDIDKGLGYLVQTDPRFTDHRTWLSSDYLLRQMSTDPATVQKRLGDGFYEQKLIREQVAELTGRRFLDGYASDEEQYRALLGSGANFAKKMNLRLGVALSASQMAQLTSDAVLLIEKRVTLPNGEVRTVLAPQLYMRGMPGNVNGAGAVMSGDTVDLKIRDDVVNSGSIAGRKTLRLDASDIRNLGGHVSAEDATLQAVNDIDNIGGMIDAGSSLKLSAGRDLNIVSSTHTSENAQGSRTNVDRVAMVGVIGSDATMTLAAGRDVNISAAQIANAGQHGKTEIKAGNDLNLGTVSESGAQSLSWGAGNERKESYRRDIGSMIAVTADLALDAGRDLNAKAADVSSEAGAIGVKAGHDILLGIAESTVSVDENHRQIGSSGWFADKTVTTRDQVDRTQVQGSIFSGDSVSLQAGNDIAVTGSDVVSTADTKLIAQRDIRIEAATNTVKETHLRDEQTSGMFGNGGIGLTIGTKAKDDITHRTASSASASSIGSTNGDVSIVAGEGYLQNGSQVLTPKGNIDIVAKRVGIIAAADIERETQDSVSTQTGLSVSISNPLISAVQQAQQLKTAAKKTKDRRMQGLAASAAAMTMANAKDAAAASAAPAGGIDLAVSIGGSKNTRHGERKQSLAQGSRLVAGGNISIAASGAGAGSDLTIQGSDIVADKNIDLRADNRINLVAAQDASEQHSSHKGISGAIGFSVGTSGYMINAGLSGSRGNGDGSDVAQRNANVKAGGKLAMASGTDTNIIGGVASGKQVAMEVGTSGAGDLNIVSLQDRSDYNSRQQSLGGSVSVGVGKMSGSINASQSKTEGEYASVNRQSGISAGDGGFAIKVNGNTHLDGSKIASTAAAVKKHKNSLSTETLTHSDIKNHSRHKASSWSVSAGGGYSGGNSALNGSSMGNGKTGGSADSMTKAGISGAAIVITDEAAQRAETGKTAKQEIASLDAGVTSSKDSSARLGKDWDGQQMQDEVTAQAEITAAFGRESSKAIGTYATDKENDLQRQARAIEKKSPAKARKLNEEAKKWSEGGAYRTAMHTAAGALTGGGDGAAGAMISTQGMPKLSDLIDKLDVPKVVRQGLAQITAATIGKGLGGSLDAASALNVEANNRQLHRSEAEMIEKNAARFAQELYETENPSAEQIGGAAAMLSNTAQHLLDNNLGVTVPHSARAEAFLQTLQTEYATISPNLSIGDDQYLFYATPDQRSDAAMNAGAAKASITDLIVRTPVAQASLSEPAAAADPTRDRRTGMALDEQGRYSEVIYVKRERYQPKYFPCAIDYCENRNLDMSDPETQAYMKAEGLRALENIGKGTSAALAFNPLNAAGALAGAVGTTTGFTYGYLDDSMKEALATEALEIGAVAYLNKVFGLPKALAISTVAVIDVAGGWDDFINRSAHYLRTGSDN